MRVLEILVLFVLVFVWLMTGCVSSGGPIADVQYVTITPQQLTQYSEELGLRRCAEETRLLVQGAEVSRQRGLELVLECVKFQ